MGKVLIALCTVFLLAFPANELVLPVAVMALSNAGSLLNAPSLLETLSAAGWILASWIWGNMESYQIVAICAVQEPPARSLMPAAPA